VASVGMSVNELKNLQEGDVILLEDTAAVEQNRRSLSGLDFRTILGKQDGDKLTVERIIFNNHFEETNP
jgi:flagellar motor switch protein FliM